MVKALLKVLVLVAVTIAMAGCVRHYAMDAANYIDMTRIASSKNPDAVKVYVGNLRFKGSSGFGNITAEGEISPWLKKGIVDALKDVSFVDNPQIADITIIPVEYNFAWTTITSTLLLDLNGKQVKLIAVVSSQIRPADDKTYNAYMLGFADLLALILKDSVTGNRIDLTKMPKEIRALARMEGPRYVGIENIKTKH
jgi:hypothetical protein